MNLCVYIYTYIYIHICVRRSDGGARTEAKCRRGSQVSRSSSWNSMVSEEVMVAS